MLCGALNEAQPQRIVRPRQWVGYIGSVSRASTRILHYEGKPSSIQRASPIPLTLIRTTRC